MWKRVHAYLLPLWKEKKKTLSSLCLCLSVSVFVCLPACLPACLPVCLPACLPACLSVCLSVSRIVPCLFGRRLDVKKRTGLSITLINKKDFISSLSLCLCLSVCLSVSHSPLFIWERAGCEKTYMLTLVNKRLFSSPLFSLSLSPSLSLSLS